MKKLISILIFVVPVVVLASTADTASQNVSNDTVKYWTFKSLNMLDIAQNTFKNWSAGGESSIAGKATVEYEIDYSKGKFTFTQGANMAYGLVGYTDNRVEKTNDKLNLSLSFSHKTSEKWSLTNLTTLKTQFSNGYKYPDDSTLISTFFAPAYLNIALGFNYKEGDKFQLFLSPVSGKITFVLDDYLADKGAYGVKAAVVDTAGNIITPGKHFLGEVGVSLFTSYKAELMKNINLSTALTLHNNYMDFDPHNRWNIDMDFDTRVVFKINEIFATVVFLHLKYDHNARFPNYETIDGEEVVVSESPKLQMNESIGLGLRYQID